MKIGKIFASLNISASGLSVQRKRMDVVARNLANVDTTRTEDGGPYQREIVLVEESKPSGRFKSMLDREKNVISTTHQKHYSSVGRRRSNPVDLGGVKTDEIISRLNVLIHDKCDYVCESAITAIDYLSEE